LGTIMLICLSPGFSAINSGSSTNKRFTQAMFWLPALPLSFLPRSARRGLKNKRTLTGAFIFRQALKGTIYLRIAWREAEKSIIIHGCLKRFPRFSLR
jgi:hypothetical protein